MAAVEDESAVVQRCVPSIVRDRVQRGSRANADDAVASRPQEEVAEAEARTCVDT